MGISLGTLMEKASQLNGATWKWIAAALLSGNFFWVGLVVGDGLASWRVGADLSEHKLIGPHPEQQTINAATEQRLVVLERTQAQVLTGITKLTESSIRIETSLGIERESR